MLASSMSRSFGIARLPRTPLRRRSQNQSVWDERMHPAGLANDPLAFRAALKSRERGDCKLWNCHESEEVLHEFFEWYG